MGCVFESDLLTSIPISTCQELLRTGLHAMSAIGMAAAFRYGSLKSLTGNSLRILAIGLGWAVTDSLLQYAAPLWIGARGLEFSWQYLEMGVHANIDLVRHHSPY